MMWKSALIAGFITAGLSAAMSPVALAAEAKPVGRVQKLGGYVTVARDGAKTRVKLHDLVYNEDVFKTGADGKVGIVFRDKTGLTISRNSEFEIAGYAVEAKKSRVAKFRLWFGRVRAVVSKFAGKMNDVSFESPTAVAGVRGTDLVVTVEPSETNAGEQSPRDNPSGFQTNVAVLEGKVAVRGLIDGGKEVVLGAGQSSTVRHNAEPGDARTLSPSEVKELQKASADPDGSATQFAHEGAGDPAGDAAAFLQAAGTVEPSNQPIQDFGENAAEMPPLEQVPGTKPGGTGIGGVIPTVPVNVELNRER